MKTLLLFAILFTISFSCSNKKLTESIKNDNGNEQYNDWSTIQYFYREGSVPPPYYHEYSIVINSDGSGNLNYQFDYSSENQPPLQYTLTFSDEQMKNLNEALSESKVLETEIKALPDSLHPIGGHVQRINVMIVDPNPGLDQPPKVIETPYFPKEEFAAGLNKLYGVINKMVQENIWNEISSKQAEYIQQNENK